MIFLSFRLSFCLFCLVVHLNVIISLMLFAASCLYVLSALAIFFLFLNFPLICGNMVDSLMGSLPEMISYLIIWVCFDFYTVLSASEMH